MNTTTTLNDKQSLRTHYVAAPPTTTSEKTPCVREALFNDGDIGPISHVQVAIERVAQLNAVLFDLDPTNLREGPLLPALSQDPDEFYERCVQRWLANHPLLQHLEVRASGTGIHAILWLDPPVKFADDAERKRWCSVVKIVQAILPTDPLAPGVTATASAVGSINTKNGQIVRRLKEGQPVAPEDVIELADEMCSAPFATLFRVLTGSDRIAPCPICNCESLVALTHIGKCVNCGKINFERFCNLLFHPRKIAEDRHG